MNKDLEEIETKCRKAANPLSDLDLEEESKSALKNQERFSEIFFRNIVDYSKWITSIALAAFLLIGAIFRDKNGIQNQFYLYLGSIVFIIISIVFSLILVYFSLKFWERECDYYFDLGVYYSKWWAVRNNLNLCTADDCEQQKKNMLEKRAKSTIYSMPVVYLVLFTGQILCLIAGILCYIIGVNLALLKC